MPCLSKHFPYASTMVLLLLIILEQDNMISEWQIIFSPHSLPQTTHPYFLNIRRLPNMDPKSNSIQSPLSRREGVTKSWSKAISFYLYPLELFPLFWGPNTSCDHSIMLTPKHDGYIHAIQAMKRHPWRTSNPHEAMLAIIPISLDIYTRGGCPGLGWLFSDVRFMHVIQLTGKRLYP